MQINQDEGNNSQHIEFKKELSESDNGAIDHQSSEFPQQEEQPEEQKQEEEEQEEQQEQNDGERKEQEDAQSLQYLPKNKKTVIKWLYTHFNTKNKLKALKKNPLFGQFGEGEDNKEKANEDYNLSMNQLPKRNTITATIRNDGQKDKQDEIENNHQNQLEDEAAKKSTHSEDRVTAEKQYTPYSLPEDNEIGDQHVMFSLNFFTKDNTIRILCVRFINSRLSTGIEITATIMNVIGLMLTDYSYRSNKDDYFNYSQNQTKYYLELISNIMFTFLSSTKIISYGLVYGPHTFLRAYWNVLDALVLTCAWISIKTITYQALNIIKLFRIIFFIRVNQYLSHQVNSFISGFKGLWKPFIPFFSVILLYSVVGLYFFSGLLESRCRIEPEPEENPYRWPLDTNDPYPCGYKECAQQSYCRNPSDYGEPKISSDTNNILLFFGFTSFNSILSSIYTVQSFFTINGWISVTEMHWRAQDQTVSGIYFGSLVLFLAHIFGNLVLATLHESFIEHHSISRQVQASQQKGEQYSLKKLLQNEIMMQEQLTQTVTVVNVKRRKSFFNKILNLTIQNMVQENEMKQLPPNSFACKVIRLYFKTAQKSLLYKSIRFINIIIQAIILCLDRYNISDEELLNLYIIDFASTIFLFLEIPFEMISNGWSKYWKENLNILDFSIGLIHVLLYSVELSLEMSLFYVTSEFSIFFRSIKILRLYRLFYSFTIFESVKVILKTYSKTLRMIPGYFVLMIILIFLYALIGREIFSEKVTLEEMRINFNSLADSLIAVIMFCFNEEWHIIMYEYYHFVGYSSIIYCLFCIYTCQVIMVRLFISIFIHNFMDWLRFFENQFQASSPFINHMSNVIKKFFRRIERYLKKRKEKKLEIQIKKQIQSAIGIKKQSVVDMSPNFLSPHIFLNKSSTPQARPRNQSVFLAAQNRRKSKVLTNLEIEENKNQNDLPLQKLSTLPVIPHKTPFPTIGTPQNKHTKSKFLEEGVFNQSEPSDILMTGVNRTQARESILSPLAQQINNSLRQFKKQPLQNLITNQTNTLQTNAFNQETLNFTENNFTNGFNFLSQKDKNNETLNNRLPTVQADKSAEGSSCQSSVIDPSIQEHLQDTLKYQPSNSFIRESEHTRKYYSFLVFSPQNSFRLYCKDLANKLIFNQIKPCFLLILALNLALQDPFLDPNSDLGKLLYAIDLALMIIFNVQTIISSVAYGPILSLEYNEVSLHINNFFEIIFNLPHFLYFMPLSSRSIYVIRVFKIFRLLLLLPFLSKKFTQISFAGRVCIACLPRMFKIMIFGIIFMFVNSVFVTKLMKGVMFSCIYNEQELEEFSIITKNDCMDLGGDWVDSLYSFDNILKSMSVLFMIQSSEGWLTIMLQQFDSTTEDLQPKVQHYSPWILFYIQFFFIANFCILNMFVGVVVDTFRELKEIETKINKLTPQQKEWYYIKHSIYKLEIFKKIKAPSNFIGRIVFENLIQKHYVKYLFNIISILNCVSIFGYTHRQPHSITTALNQINLFCMISFAIEIIIKIIALRSIYFKKKWNWFNIVMLITGLINIQLQMNYEIKSYDYFIRIFGGISKGLQLIRVYRILIHLKVMKKLLNSFFGAVSNILGLSMLVILFLFISVVISMNIFPYIKVQNTIDAYDTNFQSFQLSLFTLIRIATSEQWFLVVAECSTQQSPAFVCRDDIYIFEDYLKYGMNSCGSNLSYFFFYIFFLVFTLFILNLLIASIILSYKESYIQEESAINLYQLEDVRRLWLTFDPEGLGFINYKLFWQFSSQVAIIFGIQSEDLLDVSLKKKFLEKLNIPMFEDPRYKTLVYKFHDVVIKLAEISLMIKYQIQNLEPEEKAVKQFHKRKLLKLQKIKDLQHYHKSMFRSSDMGVIIMLTRKLKEWKKRYLDKDQDFQIFDIRNLTLKLQQFKKSASNNVSSMQSSQQLSFNNEIPFSMKESAKAAESVQDDKKRDSNLKPSEFSLVHKREKKPQERKQDTTPERDQSMSFESFTPYQRKRKTSIHYSILITPHIEISPNDPEKQFIDDQPKQDNELETYKTADETKANILDHSVKIGNFVLSDVLPSQFKREQDNIEKQKRDSESNDMNMSRKKKQSVKRSFSQSATFTPFSPYKHLDDCQLNFNHSEESYCQPVENQLIFAYEDDFDFPQQSHLQQQQQFEQSFNQSQSQSISQSQSQSVSQYQSQIHSPTQLQNKKQRIGKSRKSSQFSFSESQSSISQKSSFRQSQISHDILSSQNKQAVFDQ